MLKKSLLIFSISLMTLFFLGNFMSCAQLGNKPSGDRLEKILKSSNYRDGAFQNLEDTRMMTTDRSMVSSLWEFLVRKIPHAQPDKALPSQKTDLLKLDPKENTLVWFGHSSYFLQVDGKKFLVDPVFSGHASPFPFMVKAFEGSDIYTVEDMPEIDYLVITHDHYDHLDYKTVEKLKNKVKKVICGLGVGAHLESWGYDPKIILEGDWNESFDLGSGFELTVLTARHFSGRSFTRNQTLWASYALKTPTLNLFLGGDGGYGKHFKTIGEKYGPFDLAMLENGQYNEDWRYIHMMPEETYHAAIDLKAKKFLAVHSAKYILSKHSWDEPLKRISAASAADDRNLLITPMIGEKVNLGDPKQTFVKWWKLLDSEEKEGEVQKVGAASIP